MCRSASGPSPLAVNSCRSGTSLSSHSPRPTPRQQLSSPAIDAEANSCPPVRRNNVNAIKPLLSSQSPSNSTGNIAIQHTNNTPGIHNLTQEYVPSKRPSPLNKGNPSPSPSLQSKSSHYDRSFRSSANINTSKSSSLQRTPVLPRSTTLTEPEVSHLCKSGVHISDHFPG